MGPLLSCWDYIRVEMPHDKCYVNRLVKVRLAGFNEDKSALTVEEVIGFADGENPAAV